MTHPVFIVDDARLASAESGARVVLDGDEGRHAAMVRRVRAGEMVLLTDGRGLVAECLVVTAGRAELQCEVRSRYDIPAAHPRLVAVQALAKGGRDELAVEMLTEVGADAIVPWAAARCVVQWRGERADKARAKWVSTVREAAKQARRAWVPEVRPLASTHDVARLVENATLPVVLHESGADRVADLRLPARGDVVIVVGPEGGITDAELATFADAGARTLRLGPTVLRASTAGVAAAAALLSRTDRWR